MPRIPNVTRDDVLRIIRRDFRGEDGPVVVSLLDQYGTAHWQREKDRVQLAILKLSRGNLQQVNEFVVAAQSDFRNVLGPAEYPYSLAAAFSGRGQTSAKQLSELEETDWRQYNAWLTSHERNGGLRDDIAANAEKFVLGGPPRKRRRGFPGCAAPIVGSILGTVLALTALADRANRGSALLGITLGAVLGFVAGLVMWVIDRRLDQH